MKIITETGSEKETQERLDRVFDQLHLPERVWGRKYSGKQKYVSFSTSVTVETREQLYSLYDHLKRIPEVKYIL